MFVVHRQFCTETGLLTQTMFNRIDRTVSKAFDDFLFAVICICKKYLCIKFTVIIADIFNLRLTEMKWFLGIDIHIFECGHDLFRSDLALNFGHTLNLISQFFVHFFRKFKSIVLFKNKGNTALTGLAVDTN